MQTPPKGNYNYPTSYRIGCGRRSELPAACEELGMTKPLIITDGGLAALPWFAALREGLGAAVFSEIQGNPTGKDVADAVAAYRDGSHDGVVLVGGGSPMDVGKCVALLVDNDGDVFDYEDVGDNFKRADPAKIAPIIAMPTTAGTGSEVGRASVIVDERDRSKKIIFHPKMQPGLVLADPELTFALPKNLTAATGMDALAHCFEAYCAPGYHPMADGIALEGMRLIHQNLIIAFEEGRDASARTHMMMAASMGATAFQKGLGLVHAISHPLGGATGIHHGTSNAILLPYVMVYNRERIEPAMKRVARFLQLPRSGFDGVLDWILELRQVLGLPHTLTAAEGFDPGMAKRLAPMARADPSLATNPRSADLADLERVMVKALRGDLSP